MYCCHGITEYCAVMWGHYWTPALQSYAALKASGYWEGKRGDGIHTIHTSCLCELLVEPHLYIPHWASFWIFPQNRHQQLKWKHHKASAPFQSFHCFQKQKYTLCEIRWTGFWIEDVSENQQLMFLNLDNEKGHIVNCLLRFGSPSKKNRRYLFVC